MKQILKVVIEIESTCTHTPRNIEQALNFYWGSDGTFTVTEAAEHSVEPTFDNVGEKPTVSKSYPNELPA